MSHTKMFEVLTFTFLPNHAPGTMPSFLIFSPLDSTYFHEFLGILYMVIAILFPQWLVFNIMFLFSPFIYPVFREGISFSTYLCL